MRSAVGQSLNVKSRCLVWWLPREPWRLSELWHSSGSRILMWQDPASIQLHAWGHTPPKILGCRQPNPGPLPPHSQNAFPFFVVKIMCTSRCCGSAKSSPPLQPAHTGPNGCKKKNALNLGNVRLLFFKDCFSYLEGPWDCTWIILVFFSLFLKKEYHWCLEWDLIESVDCSGLMEILKIIYFESQSDREASIHWPMAQMIFMPMAGPSQEPGTSSGSPAWW